MQKKEYNGWTNYETWLVKLWMDNEEGTQRFFQEQAEQLLRDIDEDDRQHERISHLIDILKQYHEEALPKLEGFAADLMNAALSEVNWCEIAGSLLEDAKEVVGEE